MNALKNRLIIDAVTLLKAEYLATTFVFGYVPGFQAEFARAQSRCIERQLPVFGCLLEFVLAMPQTPAPLCKLLPLTAGSAGSPRPADS